MGNKKTDKHKKKKKYRSSSSDSSSSSSASSIDEELKKKLKKKLKKLKKKKKEKRALKKLAKEKLQEEIQKDKKKLNKKSDEVNTSTYDVNVALMEKAKALAPMTKEEWEKQQNTFKRVYDEETGRTRLIKGSGEIVEECVSRDRHIAINKQATRGDGEYFEKVLGLQKH